MPLTPLQVVLEMGAAAGLLLHLLIVLRNYQQLPERVAIHFDLHGRPNGWGPRWGLAAMTLVAAGIFLVMTMLGHLPRTDAFPVQSTAENASRQYRFAVTLMAILKLEMAWLFALLAWRMVQIAKGMARGLGAAFVIGVAIVCLATPLAGLMIAASWR